ncbi:MAG TPA: protein-L-isoaspartate O-methyltransferase [Nitrosomonas sp.]|nr:protein-L-isoaspartate O-methyltransferase [Nitrosomonas sp.]HQU97759.1 protein-L-isoaspartate O-methyltransferase [Nitrosomonas sp.]HQX13945.1 protein-L-isoaspartate O-methyltransferase [Nitrosomonas sp.]HRB20804.1 protein-L-isoaspartate O-methyltransferase [Nitrosomonas sp.]HRB31851.1 protein-L-isoaspartate O-methyltransferase [Nitrosomonas sp.]
MNLEETRFNMVVQQIRPWYVLDDSVLDMLYKIKREDFVPLEKQSMAFVDMEIPLGYGQVMLAPKAEARILQALKIQKTDKVLEVGSGSGYMTALLAEKGGHVYSVEIVPELESMAAKNLKAYNINNVTLEQGDAAQGWTKHAPYDVIVLTGSTPVLPEVFKQSLNIGGRLFAIVGEDPVMQALLITRKGLDEFITDPLFETVTVPLINAQQSEKFVF